jgi:NADH:ubiquinone oxidoreductase subunit
MNKTKQMHHPTYNDTYSSRKNQKSQRPDRTNTPVKTRPQQAVHHNTETKKQPDSTPQT